MRIESINSELDVIFLFLLLCFEFDFLLKIVFLLSVNLNISLLVIYAWLICRQEKKNDFNLKTQSKCEKYLLINHYMLNWKKDTFDNIIINFFIK